MADNTGTQEDDELEALFDSIAAEHQQTESATGVGSVAEDDESEEALEALFDNIVAESKSQDIEVEPMNDDESESGLEALFDSVAAQNKSQPEPAKEPIIIIPDVVDESDEGLEALFDSIAAQEIPHDVPVSTGEVLNISNESSFEVADSERVFNKIGHLTRTLHNTLQELGLHEEIEKVASSIPDARGRLSYVAALTNQAAEKVLNATEAAQPVLETVEADAKLLSQKWDMLFDKKLDVAEFRSLVGQTQIFLKDVPERTRLTNSYLMDIMMAQDFQDLTGQVIKKITDLTNDMERQLLALLMESVPPGKKKQDIMDSGLLNGPVINSEGRTDVVTSQDEVDDLLESLGF